ncbi:MAG: endo-1,4-beta-xylanase [Acidobacteriia bacterium]|nr:endo-1,4-beta-xylanase [Terriglobia bacterium]
MSVRMPFYWRDVEPTKDQWNLSYNDPFVAVGEQNQITILGLLGYSTEWSTSNPTGSADDLYYPPADNQAFAAYAKALVARYPQVTDWEVWNEPNLWCFWRPHPDPAQYTALLKETYTAAKAANPECTIVLGGLSSGGGWQDTILPEDFLRAVYNAGGKGYFDVVAIHPYSQVQQPQDYLADQIERVRRVMEDFGDSAKPIWITEIGWYTRGDPSAVDEAVQAERVRQVFSIAGQYPFVTKVFWYQLQDCGNDANNPQQNYGLFRADGGAKPAVTAYAGL